MFNPNPFFNTKHAAKGPIGKNPRKLITYAMDERTPTGELTIYAAPAVPKGYQMFWHQGRLMGMSDSLTEGVPLERGYPKPDAITMHPETYELVLMHYQDQRKRYRDGAPKTFWGKFGEAINKARRWAH